MHFSIEITIPDDDEKIVLINKSNRNLVKEGYIVNRTLYHNISNFVVDEWYIIDTKYLKGFKPNDTCMLDIYQDRVITHYENENILFMQSSNVKTFYTDNLYSPTELKNIKISSKIFDEIFKLPVITQIDSISFTEYKRYRTKQSIHKSIAQKFNLEKFYEYYYQNNKKEEQL